MKAFVNSLTTIYSMTAFQCYNQNKIFYMSFWHLAFPDACFILLLQLLRMFLTQRFIFLTQKSTNYALVSAVGMNQHMSVIFLMMEVFRFAL